MKLTTDEKNAIKNLKVAEKSLILAEKEFKLVQDTSNLADNIVLQKKRIAELAHEDVIRAKDAHFMANELKLKADEDMVTATKAGDQLRADEMEAAENAAIQIRFFLEEKQPDERRWRTILTL